MRDSQDSKGGTLDEMSYSRERELYRAQPHLSSSYPSLRGMFPRVTQPSAARQQLHCSLVSDHLLKGQARQENGEALLPLDLHVLGTPPAFILSQDQTLH